MSRVLLALPMPPSSNRVWSARRGGGLRQSDAYKRWITDAGVRIMVQKPGRIAGGYELDLYVPAVTRMDLDNAIAGVSDILQMHRVIENDRLAEETHLHWHGTSDDVVVVLMPFTGVARALRSAPSLSEAA